MRCKVSAFIDMLFFNKVRIVSKNFRELSLRKHFALLLRLVSFEKALAVIWLFLRKSSSMTSKYCILKISLLYGHVAGGSICKHNICIF